MTNQSRRMELDRWYERMSERYDALGEACANLRWAAEALESTGHEDEMGVLEDMKADLAREQADALQLLRRIESSDRAALEREYRQSTY